MTPPIALKITAVKAGTGAPLGEPRWQVCPEDVDPDTLLSWLEQTFGKPVELVLTQTEVNPALPVGWFFKAVRAEADLPSEQLELMVIPFISVGDGSQVAMFAYQAEQKAAFMNLTSTGRIEALTVIEQPQREYRPKPG